MNDKDTQMLSEAYDQVKDSGYLWLLRHEYDKLDINKEVKPKAAYGAIDSLAAPSVYATDDINLAAAWGMMELGSSSSIDTDENPLRMVVYDGAPRRGEKIYLYKMPKGYFNATKENKQWESKNPVKPEAEVIVNVDDYLHLIRKATPEDIKFWNKNNKG